MTISLPFAATSHAFQQKHMAALPQVNQVNHNIAFGRELTMREKGRIASLEKMKSKQLLEPLFQALSDVSLAVRLKAFDVLKKMTQKLKLIPYSKAHQNRADRVYQAGMAALQKYDNGHNLNAAIEDLRQSGVPVLFKDDWVHPKLLDANILGEYGFDDDEDIREIRRGETDVTAGELMDINKEYGVFIRPDGKRPAYFMLNTTPEKLNRGLFWHEYMHYLQHKDGGYNDGNDSFYKKELEADQFVIANRQVLDLPKEEVKLELRVWGLRLSELLMHRLSGREFKKRRYSL